MNAQMKPEKMRFLVLLMMRVEKLLTQQYLLILLFECVIAQHGLGIQSHINLQYEHVFDLMIFVKTIIGFSQSKLTMVFQCFELIEFCD